MHWTEACRQIRANTISTFDNSHLDGSDSDTHAIHVQLSRELDPPRAANSG